MVDVTGYSDEQLMDMQLGGAIITEVDEGLKGEGLVA